jgi:branched-chain amino acid transport system permease protein
VLERALFRHLYRATDLAQCLLTIGVVFMSIAGAAYVWGTVQQPVALPAYLQGSVTLMGASFGAYRLFLVGAALVITIALVAGLEWTRFGAQVRAAVDNQRMARGLGIDVDGAFAVTFALGSGLAGLGGALGADILGLDPTFPLKFMVYFLIVCAVGGTSSITGPLVAALVLGIADVMGKYYAPKLGAFVVYVLMIAILLWRPQGLFTRESGR